MNRRRRIEDCPGSLVRTLPNGGRLVTDMTGEPEIICNSDVSSKTSTSGVRPQRRYERIRKFSDRFDRSLMVERAKHAVSFGPQLRLPSEPFESNRCTVVGGRRLRCDGTPGLCPYCREPRQNVSWFVDAQSKTKRRRDRVREHRRMS